MINCVKHKLKNHQLLIINTYETMKLEILSPQEKLYQGEVKLVKLPGTKGSFEILENHAPIISTLEEGKIKLIDTNDDIKYFDIKEGVVEVQNNELTVLVGSV